MNFPQEYTKHGSFKLHSGQSSNTFYDVNALLTNKKYLEIILGKIPVADHYVGIATGGAILAAVVAHEKNTMISFVKDGELKGPTPHRYVLIDDVVTTEESLNEAISIIGKPPETTFTVMDRRKKKNLAVASVFTQD